jgi:hypothetical protein
MNIEDLMNIKVTSVLKAMQKLSRTPSGVFVAVQKDGSFSQNTVGSPTKPSARAKMTLRS